MFYLLYVVFCPWPVFLCSTIDLDLMFYLQCILLVPSNICLLFILMWICFLCYLIHFQEIDIQGRILKQLIS